jgi:hypothetical protein
MVLVAVGLVVANGALTIQQQIATELHLAPLPIFWWFLILPASFFVSVLVHEGGHWLGGLAMKQQCIRIVVWPLEWNQEDGHWRFQRVRGLRFGLAELVPSSFDSLALQRIVVALAGPLASLCGGALLMAASLTAAEPVFFAFCSATALSMLLGVLEMVPFRAGNTRSDGYRLFEAIRGGSRLDLVHRDTFAMASHYTAVRPRDWPRAVILRLLVTERDPAYREFIPYLAYVHFLDAGDPEAAGPYLLRVLATWSADAPPEHAFEAAYFFARHEHNLQAAQSWLSRESRNAEPWVRQRAEAAVSLAAGRESEAHLQIQDALKALDTAPSCGAYAYETDLLRELVAVLQPSI